MHRAVCWVRRNVTRILAWCTLEGMRRAVVVVACAGLFGACDGVFGLNDDAPEQGSDAAPVADAIPDVGKMDAPLFECPASYTKIGDSFYRIGGLDAPADWRTAEHACVADGTATIHTHLAVLGPDALTELLVVHNFFHAGHPERETMYAWIGLTNLSNPPPTIIGTPPTCGPGPSSFRWVSAENSPVPGDSVNPPWADDDPVQTCTQNCVRLQTNPRISNLGCQNMHPYICECDASPEAPDHIDP